MDHDGLDKRDRRMVAYALWLQGHTLLERATWGARKGSEMSIEDVRSCMDDGNRLLEIAQSFREERTDEALRLAVREARTK